MSGSSSFFNALTDPGVDALLGMAQGFGQAAMPSRMPVPFGAALGMGLGGALPGMAAGQALQKSGIENQRAQMLMDWYRQNYGGTGAAPFGAPAGAGGTGAAPNANSLYLRSPQQIAGMGDLAMATGQDRSAATLYGMPNTMAGGAGYAMSPSGVAFPVPGGAADPRTVYQKELALKTAGVGPAAVQAGAVKAAEAPYVAPTTIDVPNVDSTGAPVLDAQGNPTFRKQTMTIPQANAAAGGAPPAGSVTPTADPFPGWAKRINGAENGTGNPGAKNPQSSATGNGQFVDGTWPSVIRSARPDLAAGKTDAQLMALRTDPDLAQTATEIYGRQNGAALAQAGYPVNGATVAMAHGLGPGGAISVLQKTDNTPVAAFMPKPVIDANPYLQNGATVGDVKQFYARRMGYGGTAGQAAAQPSYQVAGSPVAPPAAVAPPVAQPGIAGPPVITPQQQADLDVNTAWRKPQVLRPGGMVINVPGQSEIKNPELREAVQPNGQTVPVHINPPSPFAPAGTPGTATPINMETPGAGGQPPVPGQQIVTKLPPQQQEGRDEAVKEFLTKDNDAYQAAQNTQAWLHQIDQAADTMTHAGPLYMTGPYADQRLSAMSGINDMARSIGLSPPFNQQAVASWEEMKKATTTAGFELSSHYEGHARQAAQTIMNATSAVPAQTNSPVGQKLVSAGIREGAQSAIDLHNYKQGIYNTTQGAGLESAENDFYQAHPAQQYAARAISTVHPVQITDPKQFNNYLPGTYATLPNGKLVQVPARPGAPPIPAYLQQAPQ